MEKTILKIRDLIEDNAKSALDIFEYLTSDIFTLTEANPVESTISVYLNGSEHNGSGQWSFDSNTNKITVSGLIVGDIIEINYDAYIKYSDGEIKGFIRASLVHISVEGYKDFMNRSDNLFPTPDVPDDNLIALISSILIKGSIRSYKTPEFTLSFNENESQDQKIRKAVRQFKNFYGYLEYVDLAEDENSEDD